MRSALAFLLLLLGVGAAHAQGVVQPATPIKTPPAYLASDGATKVDPLGAFIVNPDGTQFDFRTLTSGGSGTSSTTAVTPYLIGSTTASSTVGTFVQVLAANSTRTRCAITNTGTGVETIRLNTGTDTTQPASGSVSPYILQVGGMFSCGLYKGIVWARSTVASDPIVYEDDR